MLAQEFSYVEELLFSGLDVSSKHTSSIPINFLQRNQKLILHILKILDKHSKNEFRNIVLKCCGFENFKFELQKLIRLLFNN